MTPHPVQDFALFDEHIHLLGIPPAARVQLDSLLENALAVREGVTAQDWSALSISGSGCLGIGHASFALLQEAATTEKSREEAESRQAGFFARLFVSAADGNGSQALLDVLRGKLDADAGPTRLEDAISRVEDRLGSELDAALKSRIRAAAMQTEDRLDLEASVTRLSEGEVDDVTLLDAYSPQLDTLNRRHLEEQSDWVFSCLTRGLLARVHAEFNLAQRIDRAPAAAVDTDELRHAMEAVIADAQHWLTSGQRRIYCGLLDGNSPDDIARDALALVGEIERRLLNFVRIQSAMRQTMLFLRAEGKGTASERIGRIAAHAGMLMREAIASHCASYRVALGVLSVDPPDDLQTLMRKTAETAFSTELPNGRDVALKDIEASAEDDFVEIEGFVTAIDALRLADGKLVSRIVLHDPSSDTTANAVAIFAHLPHAGVTVDSFVRVNGLFKSSSSLFDGEPAVEIDALSLDSLSASSWRIGFLRLADRWYEPWRNGANLIWSLGPHGARDDTEGHFGAGELLYLPLFRR